MFLSKKQMLYKVAQKMSANEWMMALYYIMILQKAIHHKNTTYRHCKGNELTTIISCKVLLRYILLKTECVKQTHKQNVK